MLFALTFNSSYRNNFQQSYQNQSATAKNFHSFLLKTFTPVPYLSQVFTPVMNSEKCRVCKKTLSDKRSLRRHMKDVHKHYAQTNVFVCDECAFAIEKSCRARDAYETTTQLNPPTLLPILRQVFHRQP